MADSASQSVKPGAAPLTGKAGVSSGTPGVRVAQLGFKSSTRLLLQIVDWDFNLSEVIEAYNLLRTIFGDDLDTHIDTQHKLLRARVHGYREGHCEEPRVWCQCHLCQDGREHLIANRAAVHALPKQPAVAPKKTIKPGVVYLLKAGEYHKIGMSTNMESRKSWFDITLPFETVVVHTIDATDPLRLERKLHECFSDKRIRGEWFSLSAQDVAYITSLQEGYL